MRVHVQLVNIYKQFEMSLEFDLSQLDQDEYGLMMKEFEGAVEEYEKAKAEYDKELEQSKEEKRASVLEHPGKAPSWQEQYEERYEKFKARLDRRWHNIVIYDQDKMGLMPFLEQVKVQLLSNKLGCPDLASGKYRVFRRQLDGQSELGPNDEVENEDRITLEFIR